MLKGPIPLKVIKTQRLLIRPVRSTDAVLMHDAMKDSFDDLKAWMPWAQSLASVRDTEVYLIHGERIWSSPAHEGVEQPLQIMDPTNRHYLGATGIKPANLSIPSFEIGYWVNKQYAGQGLITEAMNVLTRYLFQVLKAKRVEINCEEANLRSAKVAQRLNFELEGMLRNHRFDATGKNVTHSMIYSCIDVNKIPPMSFHWE